MRFTTIPFLIAFMAGLLLMRPLDIYEVNAWNHGTEEIEPWRSKAIATQPIRQTVRTLARSARQWFAAVSGQPDPLACAIVAVAAVTVWHGHADGASLAIVAVAGNLKVLRQRAADIHQEMRALNDTVVGENRKMSDEERTKLGALKDRYEANKEQLELAEQLNEQERVFGKVDADPDDKAAVAGQRSAANGGAGTGFANFGERLQAVRLAALPQGRVDPRLMQAIAPGMNESNPSDGGFFVDQDRVTTVRQRMYETGQILSRVFQLPIGPNSNGVKLMAVDETSRADGSRYGGITSYWLDEGGIKTASKPRFRPMELSLKKVAALVRVTDELLADSVALEAWVMRFLPLELTFRAEDAIVSGTGAGMPLGFLNSGAAVVVPRTTPGTIVFEDIQNMWSRFYAPSRSAAGAAWFIDQSAEPALFSMSLQIGAGGIPVYLPANGISNKPYSTLFGLPVIPAEYLSALGTKGDVMLADLSQYTLIDKGGVQSASSIHVYFVTDETAFRFVYRVDGQPEWNAPLTPKNGGPQLSPFVVLAT